MTSTFVVAADIGGTKTNVALYELSGSAPPSGRPHSLSSQRVKDQCRFQKTYSSRDASGLDEIVERFLLDAHVSLEQRPGFACFGVAGPIVDERCSIPNLHWDVDGPALRSHFGFQSLVLLNDLEATGLGIPALSSDELGHLSVGTLASGVVLPAAVIAAGTGLGMAVLVPEGDAWTPLASEGGHVDFAPRNDLEMDLLRFLLRRHERVSVERVVSGPGLVSVYEFLSERDGDGSAALREAVSRDRNQAASNISSAALEQTCPVAARALELFVSQYGAAAGNLALVSLARGGVYVAGGIAPKILPKLKDGTFMRAFTSKGRLSPVVEQIPVRVVLNPNTALLGAARRGLHEAAGC